MKQEIISHINTLKEETYALLHYLYDHPEKSFFEEKASHYLTTMLKSHNFDIERKYLNINTAFHAQLGSGHPKICFICKYSAAETEGHIYGNNANAALTIAAALGLAHVIPKLGKGSVIVIGCPGQYSNGAEMTMMKENAFEDMDIIFAPHVDIANYESGTSLATMPIKITFSNNGTNCNSIISTSSFQSCLSTFNIILQLLKEYGTNYIIDNVSMISPHNPHSPLSKTEASFYIKTPNMQEAQQLETKLKNLLNNMSTIYSFDYTISLFEIPCMELVTNKTLSRLYAHNLKENGIINIECCKNAPYGVGIGAISHTTPCIYPSISIIKDEGINCPSPEFAKATITDFAKTKILNAAEALAITSLDLLEREDLLLEVTRELYEQKK